jgi:hypothetical protein
MMKTRAKNRNVLWNANQFTNLILFSGGTLSFSALCFFLYYYAWTGQRQFTTSTAAAVHYATLTSVSIFLFASLKFRPAYKIGLALICVSCTAGVYGVEFFLARSNADLNGLVAPFWGFNSLSAEKRLVLAKYAAHFGVKVDTRGGWEVVDDLRKQGDDAAPPIMVGTILSNQGTLKIRSSAYGGELVPMAGLADRLTVLCNESGEYVTYESDEHGFRNPHGIWNSRHADLAALGESFVQGYCVADGKSFVDLLRKRYPVTLNLGMSGQSALLQLGAIKEYLTVLAPRITLWFYCEGIDLYDINAESQQPFILRYLEPTFSQHLLERQNEIDRALSAFLMDGEQLEQEVKPPTKPRALDKWIDVLKLPNLRNRAGLVYGMSGEDSANLAMLKQEKNALAQSLQRAKALVKTWGGALYFVYIPSWERYGGHARRVDIEHTATLDLVSALGIPIIDVEPAFRAQPDPLDLFPMRTFGHYNEEGNRLIANTILHALPEGPPPPPLLTKLKPSARTHGANNRLSH